MKNFKLPAQLNRHVLKKRNVDKVYGKFCVTKTFRIYNDSL